MQNKFFGSKLNTILLLILIVLLGVTIWMMKNNKILSPFTNQVSQTPNNLMNADWKEYTNDQYGYSINYPMLVNSGMEIQPGSDQYFCDSEKCGDPAFYTGFFIKDGNGKEINRIDVIEDGDINKLKDQEVVNTKKVKIGQNEFVVGDNTSWLGNGKVYFIQHGDDLLKITFIKDEDGKEYSSYVDLASLKFTK